MKLPQRLLVTILLVLASAAAGQDLAILSIDAPVGPRDVLKIVVLEDPTISTERVTVNDDGVIPLNVVGRVQVSSLTSTQIEAKLKALLESNFLAKATVSVQVIDFASKPISVVGAVVRPGLIGGSGNTTLIQALTQAGGLIAGHGRELYVLRTGRNGLSEQVAINIDDLMVAGKPELNIPLLPNDLVNVQVATPIAIYIMGEVMKPGKLEFRSSHTPTLIQAIAAAGGNTDRASSNVVVKRMVNGKQVTIKANFHRILDGKQQDVVLLDNDTIWLREALF